MKWSERIFANALAPEDLPPELLEHPELSPDVGWFGMEW